MSAALEYYLDPTRVGPEWCTGRLRSLHHYLLHSFHQLQQTSSNDDSNCREIVIWNHPSAPTIAEAESEREDGTGIICFTINGIGSKIVQDVLRNRNIFVSVCSAESTFIDSLERRLPDRVRVSIHYFNTEIEIFILCEVIKELIFEDM